MDVDPVIWSKVHAAFVEAFEVDDDEVTFDTKIIEELDAESLDFLDIAYRLETSFGIKIPRGGIEGAARESAENDGLNPDGTLTEDALIRLQAALPEVPAEEFVIGLRSTDIINLFRVGTFYNLVIRLQADQSEAV